MSASYEREIRNCIKLEQIRTGHPEKVPHHQIRIPDRLQLREAVKYIESFLPLPGNKVINRHGKRLKLLIRVKPEDLYALHFLQNRLMLGKTYIDHSPPVPNSLPGKRPGKQPKLFYIRYLPYHIVPQADKIQNFIQLRKTTLNSVKCCHSFHPPIYKISLIPVVVS